MSKIEGPHEFVPVNIAILTISDSRTQKDDKSGRIIEEMAREDGHEVIARDIVKDEIDAIAAKLRAFVADPRVDVVISTGGTGLTGRDVTPEALKTVIDKEIEGFGELFRWVSYKTVGTSTMQSRAIGGVAGTTYIFALPGSPGACRDGWKEILSRQLDARHRPCNLVELMPRLQESG